jgi:ribosome-binding protein aMBF1 (putative translation factor)
MGGTAVKRRISERLAREKTVPWEETERRVLTNPEVRFLYEDLHFRRQIAVALTEARKRAGLTQAGLAARIGSTQSVVARFEGGAAGVPSLHFLDRVARALGLRLALTLEKAA